MLGKLKDKIKNIDLGHRARTTIAVTSATILSLFATSCGDGSVTSSMNDIVSDQQEVVDDLEEEIEVLELTLANKKKNLKHEEKELKKATMGENAAK